MTKNKMELISGAWCYARAGNGGNKEESFQELILQYGNTREGMLCWSPDPSVQWVAQDVIGISHWKAMGN